MRSEMNTRSATDIDKKVGENLYKLRLYRGMTQEELAETVGITFQQIQKYEHGTNRISVSRLWQFSKILQVSVAGFYEGVDGEPVYTGALKLTVEQLAVIRKYDSLSDHKKKSIREYLKFLQEQEC